MPELELGMAMLDGVLEFNYTQEIINQLYVKTLFLIPASKISGVHKYLNLELRLVSAKWEEVFYELISCETILKACICFFSNLTRKKRNY